MEVMYCYELNKETGEITKSEIADYETLHRYQETIYWYKKNGRVMGEVREKNLGKLVNWKIHTFENDDDKIKYMMLKELRIRNDKAFKEYTKWNNAMHALSNTLMKAL